MDCVVGIRGASMISLIHTRGSVTVQYPSLEEYEQPPSKYAIGWLKPNYPMPAIPLACAIHPDLVQIAEAIWFEGEWEFDLICEFEKTI